jgi:hypothetical protein
MNLLLRRTFVPEDVHPKGLTDEPMTLLPPMNLTDFGSIEFALHESDLCKRLEHHCGRWHRGVSLLPGSACWCCRKY